MNVTLFFYLYLLDILLFSIKIMTVVNERVELQVVQTLQNERGNYKLIFSLPHMHTQ